MLYLCIHILQNAFHFNRGEAHTVTICTTYTRPSCVVQVASASTHTQTPHTDKQTHINTHTQTPHPGSCFVVIKAHKSKPLTLSSLILHHHCTCHNSKLFKFLPQIVTGEIVSNVLDVYVCVSNLVRTISQTLLARHKLANISV